MKRKLITVSLIAVILSLLSVGTVAYFTTQGRAANVITTGSLEFVIHEKTATGEDFPKDGIVIMPGDEISKVVTIENVGGHPMYLRVALEQSVNDAALTAGGCIRLDINTEHWTYRDGYYYYNQALQAGGTTEPLYTTVFIDGKNVGNAYLGKVFALDISAYAVQSENNGATPFDALGWPEN